MKPLNSKLYAVLLERFKSVRIQNAGQPYQYVKKGSGRDITIETISSGEEYCVCCPSCTDTRHRLNINYMFGEWIGGQQMYGLAHCWNEDCPDVRKVVIDLLSGFSCLGLPGVSGEEFSGSMSYESVARECCKNHIKLEDVKRVDTLDASHPAVKYLENRNYDVSRMGGRYAFHYCGEKGPRFAQRRIIIPVLYEVDSLLQIIGWQARSIPGHSLLDTPKYWTAPGYRKSYFLFDYHEAIRSDFVVVVEGPLDAVRIGVPAVAILGKTMSQHQAMQLFNAWNDKDGPIILIGDPGFKEDWEKNADKLRELFNADSTQDRVSTLEFENDPGDTDAASLWKGIRDERDKYEVKREEIRGTGP